MYDLHTHSRHSDGRATPSELAALAFRVGLTGVALTDHDTLAGWSQMADACRRRGLRFVPGVELSSEDCGRSVHLLGYWVDPGDPALAAECDRLGNERLRRTRAMLERLARLGIDVPLEEVVEHARGAPLTRPHIAEVLVARGVTPDVPTAFERYLADGAVANVTKHALSPEEAVELIRGAGGVAVLAHPAVDRRDEVSEALLERLVTAGLGGVEAVHPGHDEERVSRWRRLAADSELLVIGSSDFHGRYEDERMGRCTTSPEVVHRLAQRAASLAATEG